MEKLIANGAAKITWLNKPIREPALVGIMFAFAALWFASVGLMQTGKDFGENPDFWLAVFFSCPLLNLIFAILLTYVYLRGSRKRYLVFATGIILSLSPFIFWITLSIRLGRE